MTKDTFADLNLKFRNYRSHLGWAYWTLFKVLALTALSIGLSYSGFLIFLIMGQVLLAISILQWFILLHDFGHNHFFKSEIANSFWGHIASLFCLVPFTPWKAIHAKHHTWTGWQDKDPTMETTLQIREKKKMWPLTRLVWKLWIPAITLAFSFKNFWNLSKLFRLFVETKLRINFIFSILLLLGFVFFIIPLIPQVWITWLPGYFLFLVISDPLLLSQHTHVPQNLAAEKEVRPIPVYEQDTYTRELVFPSWVSNYLLLNFDKHISHHIWPNIPCYHLNKVVFDKTNLVLGSDWFLKVKKLPGDELLFLNRKDTGWKI